jgi:hypothetical protein
MARSDWTALLTEPAAEYLATTELQRFGLAPYLPQFRKRQHSRSGQFITRRYPLFPRYLLIPINEAHHASVRLARGVCKFRPVLADDSGRPWRAPERVIDAVKRAEQVGYFDEILHKGDYVTMTYGVLATIKSVCTTEAQAGMVELLTPLFGGARATANAAHLVSP